MILLLILQMMTSVMHCAHTCRQRDLRNNNAGSLAAGICLANGTLESWIAAQKLRNKVQYVFELNDASTSTINIFDTNDLPNLNLFKEPFVSGTQHWPLPNLSANLTLPITKMSQTWYSSYDSTSLYQQFSYNFSCKGIVYFGCYEDNKTSPFPSYKVGYSDNSQWQTNRWTTGLENFNCLNVSANWSPNEVPCGFYCSGCQETGDCNLEPECKETQNLGQSKKECGTIDNSAMGRDNKIFSLTDSSIGDPTFIQNCYCSFTTDVCDFEKFVTGRNSPQFTIIQTDEEANKVTLENPTDYTKAYLKVNQTQPFRKIMNITARLKVGFGISSVVEIVVCGLENLTSTDLNDLTYFSQPQSALDYAFDSSQMKSAFTFTYPPTPVTNLTPPVDQNSTTWPERDANYDWYPAPIGWQNCTIKFVKLYNDEACSDPYVGSAVMLDTQTNSAGFFGVKVNKSEPFRKKLYYCVINKGKKTANKTLDIEICGNEKLVQVHKDPIDFDLQLNDQTYSSYFVDRMFTVTDTLCPKDILYDVVQSDGKGGYTTSSFASVNASTKQLIINTTRPTDPYEQTHYIRAKMTSGSTSMIAFTLKICGAEKLSNTTDTVQFFKSHFGNTTSTNSSIYEVDTKFDFANSFVNSNPKCPITSYIIEDTKENFQKDNVFIREDITTRQLLYNTVPTQGGYDYKEILVIARTKADNISNQASVKIRVKVCGNEKLLNPLNISQDLKYVYPKQSTLEYKNVSDFRVSSDYLCPVATYSLWTKDTGGNLIQFNNCEKVCLQANKLVTKCDNPLSLQLYLKVQTVTNFQVAPYIRQVEDTQPINIKVCGSEILTLKLTSDPIYYKDFNSGTVTLHEDISQWFSSNDTDCPVKYNLIDSESKPVLSPVKIEPGTKGKLTTTTSKNQKQDFYVIATTVGQVIQTQKFTLQICGEETLSVKVKKLNLLYELKTGNNGFQSFDSVNSLISSSDDKYCETEYFLEQNGQRYEGNLAIINSLNFKKQLQISTEKPVNQTTLKLSAMTKGGKTSSVDIMIEVCGSELIEFTTNVQQISLTFPQNSGNQKVQIAKPMIYSMIKSSNPRCDINKELTKLMKDDSPYVNDASKVEFNTVTTEFRVNTANVYTLNLQLKVETTSGQPFYIPVMVSILPMEKIKVDLNRPPIFEDPSTRYFDFVVDSLKDEYRFEMPVSKQFDEMNMLKWLNISNPILGNVKYIYEESSQIAVLFEDSLSPNIKKLRFEQSNNNSLVCTLKQNQLPKLKNVIYPIVLLLQDTLGLSTKKIIMFNLTIHQDIYKVVEDKQVETEIDVQTLATIQSISVFGEVDITFNSSDQWRPKKISKQHIARMTDEFEVYIEPADNWDRWLEGNPQLLNLTFEIREFSEEKLRLKLNFENYQSISPFAKYDKLKIHVVDMPSMFDFTTQSDHERSLEQYNYHMIMEKSIQKQMHDSKETRNMVNLMYSLRSYMTLIFMWSVVLALVERGPFNRLLQLTLIMQLIFNLPLLHVPLPGSYMITAQIFKPWVSFNLAKGIFLKKLEKDKDTELQLESLGQRDIFRYSSFSAVRNLETIGFLICLIIAKTLLMLFIKGMQECTRKRRSRQLPILSSKKYDSILGKVVQSDFLLFLTLTFIELATAGLLAFKAPKSQFDLGNVLFSCLLIGGIFVVLPLIYYQIYSEAEYTLYRSSDFSKKWGFFLLGVHIKTGYIDRFQRKSKFSYLICFFGVRYVFVLISFYIENMTLQIMILIPLFLLQAINFCAVFPFGGKWNNRLGLFNRISVLLVFYHLMFFTDYVDQQVAYYAGFSLIITIIVFIMVNLLFWVLEVWHLIWQNLDKLKRIVSKVYYQMKKKEQVKNLEPQNEQLDLERLMIETMLPATSAILSKVSRVQCEKERVRELTVIQEKDEEHEDDEIYIKEQESFTQLLQKKGKDSNQECQECGLPAICKDKVPFDDEYCHSCQICHQCSRKAISLMIGESNFVIEEIGLTQIKESQEKLGDIIRQDSHCSSLRDQHQSCSDIECSEKVKQFQQHSQCLDSECKHEDSHSVCSDLDCLGTPANKPLIQNHDQCFEQCCEKQLPLKEAENHSQCNEPDCQNQQDEKQQVKQPNNHSSCSDLECQISRADEPNGDSHSQCNDPVCKNPSYQNENDSKNNLSQCSDPQCGNEATSPMNFETPVVKKKNVTFANQNEVISTKKKKKSKNVTVFNPDEEAMNTNLKSADLEKFINPTLFD